MFHNLIQKLFLYLDSKTWFINLKLGIKQANSIPTLPSILENYYNHPITRVFRVIGGIVAAIVILKKHLLCPYPINIILAFIALVQLAQIIFISITKVVFGIYLYIKFPEKFEVRNSPLNTTATHIAKLAICWKYGCSVGATSVSLLAAGVTIDTVLEASDRPKLFQPIMSKVLGAALPVLDPQDPRVIAQNYRKRLINLSEANTRIDELKRALEEIQKVDLNEYNLTSTDKDAIKKSLADFMHASAEEQDQIRKELFEIIDKNDKN